MSPVSACASKWSIDTRPKPWCRATPVASGQGDGVVAAEHDRDRRPRPSRCARPPRARRWSARRHRSTSRRHRRRRPAGRAARRRAARCADASRRAQVVGLPDRHRAEPGARPVRRTAVEGAPRITTSASAYDRRVVERASVDAEERDVRTVLGAVPGHQQSTSAFGTVPCTRYASTVLSTQALPGLVAGVPVAVALDQHAGVQLVGERLGPRPAASRGRGWCRRP